MQNLLQSYLALLLGSGIVGLVIFVLTIVALLVLIKRVFFSSAGDIRSSYASCLIFCFSGNLFVGLQQYRLLFLINTGGLGAHDTYLLESVYATLLHLAVVWGITGAAALFSLWRNRRIEDRGQL